MNTKVIQVVRKVVRAFCGFILSPQHERLKLLSHFSDKNRVYNNLYVEVSEL